MDGMRLLLLQIRYNARAFLGIRDQRQGRLQSEIRQLKAR